MNISTETDSQTQRTDLWLPKGKGRGRDGLAVWDQQMQTLIYRMDKQEGPTVQHSELCSISCENHNGKEYEKIYIFESLCRTPENNTTL